MAYEPINGTQPLPKKRGFNKKSLLVMLLLASITAAAIVVIVLFTTTSVFSSRTSNSSDTPTASTGLNAQKYDSQTTKLNGGLVCEDFAADAKKTMQNRNFKVLTATYTNPDGSTGTVSGDDSYDQQLVANKQIVPNEVSYYGRTQKWGDIGDRYMCGLTAQKFDQAKGQFVAPESGVRQSLLSDPLVFPIDNVQLRQPSALDERLFEDNSQVAGFYDFLFNYFNHGPEIMELTTISFEPLPPYSNTLGDYRAPARALQIKVSMGELYLLKHPPKPKVSTASDEEWNLARRINAIWPVLSHEYGHHLVETYAKRFPVNGDNLVDPSGLSYTFGSIDKNCSQILPALKMPNGSGAALNCDGSIFNYGLMDGVLSLSGYSSSNTVKKVNFGSDYDQKSGTFANGKDFPVDYQETDFSGKNTSYDYILSNTVWNGTNVPENALGSYILNSYRFSYDEILARLYNLSSAPYMNASRTYRSDQYGMLVQNTADNFRQEYSLHEQINTYEFQQSKPMIGTSAADQIKLRQIGGLFEQMRASGAPLSYVGSSLPLQGNSVIRTLYGTSPSQQKYMLLRDDNGYYSTVRLEYGVTPTAAAAGAVLPTLKIDNSMQLIKDNASATHDYGEVYEWDGFPLTYKSSRAYPEMFQQDANNANTFFASLNAAASDDLINKRMVGFTNTLISAITLLPPSDASGLTIDANIYSKAFFQSSHENKFVLRANATGTVKRMTKIDKDAITFEPRRDSFSAQIDTMNKTIRFVSAPLRTL